MKIITYVLTIFCFSIGVAQYNFNKIYTYPDHFVQSTSLIQLPNNNYFLYSQFDNRLDTLSSFIHLMELNDNGELIWEDTISDLNDRLYPLSVLEKNNIINDSTILLISRTSSNNKLNFIKYDLNNKETIQNSNIVLNFDFSVGSFIKDNFNNLYFWGWKEAGLGPGTQFPKEMFMMKVDINGNVLWTNSYSYCPLATDINRETIGMLEFLNDSTIIAPGSYLINWIDPSGFWNPISESNFMLFDMAGNVINDTIVNDLNRATLTVTHENNFYNLTEKDTSLHFDKSLHITKYDADFNLLWDKPIELSYQYYINMWKMRLVGDEIIFVGQANFDQYTQSNLRGYIASYSLEGVKNWEHSVSHDNIMFYEYLTNFTDLENGGFAFCGRVMKSVQNNVFPEESLWLLKTDENGCVIENDCYDSIEEQFGLVDVSDFIYTQQNQIKILENPAKTTIKLQIESDFLIQHQNLEVVVYNIAGTQMFSENLNESNFTKNIQNWQNGVYVVSVLSAGNMVWNGKLVKH